MGDTEAQIRHEVLTIRGLRQTIARQDEAMRQLRESHAAVKADNARLRVTLAAILDVTAETHVDGVTRERPYTALSRIDGLAREGLRLLCIWKHEWKFHHDANPPVVRCTRCGRTDPMPYGDARMPYL